MQEEDRTETSLADPVVIGVIAAPHGVRGTLRVKPLGSGRHLRKGVAPVVDGARRRIVATRETPKGFLVDLEGVGSRDLASSLRGLEMVLDRSELDAPEEEEFYVGDLIGLDVHNDATGEVVGVVVDIFETPAHEVLVMRDASDEESYVPFTREFVPEVDPGVGHVVVDLPDPE